MYTPLPFRESLEADKKPKVQAVEDEQESSGPPEIPPEEIIFNKERDFLGMALNIDLGITKLRRRSVW